MGRSVRQLYGQRTCVRRLYVHRGRSHVSAKMSTELPARREHDMARADAFGARAALPGVDGTDFYRLERLHQEGVGDPAGLPASGRILLANLLRNGGASALDDGPLACT